MKTTRIGELCELKYGKALKKSSRKSGDIPVYGSNGIVGEHDKAFINHSTIIIGRKGSIGEVHLALGKSWAIDTTYYVVLKDPTTVNLNWFFLLLKTLNLQNLNRSAAIPGLNRDDVYRIKIPFPTTDDQTRIATLLSKVESLIAKRKKSIADLDELLKSIFWKIFSIKGEGFKKWEIDNLSKHSEIVSGVAKGKKYNKTKLIEIPYLRVANVQDGFLNLDEVKTIFVSEREIDKCLLRSGDVLLTEGGDPDKLGRGSVWEGQIDGCIHQNHIFRVRINNNKVLNPKYLSGLIGSVYGKSYFLKSAKQTTGIASINSTQLKKFPVILPPINLQNKFADIVEKVKNLKEKYQKTLNDFESLYGALSQKAFKGELDLTRIPVAHDLGVEDELGFETIVGQLAVQGKSDKAPQTREQFLHRLFNGFIADTTNGTLSLDDFWLEAEEKLTDLMDEDASPLGVADYDRVRDWLFDMLAQGKVAQVFNEQENRMEIRPVP
jgi:type I restriction enzyme S subunit